MADQFYDDHPDTVTAIATTLANTEKSLGYIKDVLQKAIYGWSDDDATTCFSGVPGGFTDGMYEGVIYGTESMAGHNGVSTFNINLTGEPNDCYVLGWLTRTTVEIGGAVSSIDFGTVIAPDCWGSPIGGGTQVGEGITPVQWDLTAVPYVDESGGAIVVTGDANFDGTGAFRWAWYYRKFVSIAAP